MTLLLRLFLLGMHLLGAYALGMWQGGEGGEGGEGGRHQALVAEQQDERLGRGRLCAL